jgi:hypothetical protein
VNVDDVVIATNLKNRIKIFYNKMQLLLVLVVVQVVANIKMLNIKLL